RQVGAGHVSIHRWRRASSSPAADHFSEEAEEEAMRPPFRLVPDTISADTVETLQALLNDARAGKAIDIGFVVMYRGRRFIANAPGEARRSPVFTRGMLTCLDDKLSRQIDNPL